MSDITKSPENVIEIEDFITVRELASLMDVSPIDVIKELMSSGIMANINQQIDFDTAAIVAEEFGFEAVRPAVEEKEEFQAALQDEINYLDREIDRLDERLDAAGDEVAQEYRASIDELRQERQELAADLEQLEAASEAEFAEMREGISDAVASLGRGLREAERELDQAF